MNDLPVAALPSPRFSQRRERAQRQAIGFLMQQAVENPDVLSLAAGLVDPATLPGEIAREAATKLLGDPVTARQVLQYGTTPGSDVVRTAMLEHLARLEGTNVDGLGVGADRIVLTTGSQQLLHLVADVLFDPGDICLVAAPTYFVFLGVLDGVGARAVPVEADEHGMCMDALEQELRRIDAEGEIDRVKMVYLVSYYENPSGALLSTERRERVLEITRNWSRKQPILVLEDAAYRELRYDEPALPSIWSLDRDRERVILAQTFSKRFSPGVRVGFGVLPSSLVKPVQDRKGNEDFGSANLNQHLVAHVLRSGRYAEHVARLRDSYGRKRDAMLAAAERYFSGLPGVTWMHPRGGLYVWMTFPEHVDASFNGPLFDRATREHEVMYVPGDLCFAGPEARRPRNHARLSFGVQDVAGIELGMQRLARAVADVV